MKFAEGLKAFISQEFGAKIDITTEQTPCTTGAFEVTVDGTLIHSKLEMGHGKCQSDEELDNIINKIGEALGS